MDIAYVGYRQWTDWCTKDWLEVVCVCACRQMVNNHAKSSWLQHPHFPLSSISGTMIMKLRTRETTFVIWTEEISSLADNEYHIRFSWSLCCQYGLADTFWPSKLPPNCQSFGTGYHSHFYFYLYLRPLFLSCNPNLYAVPVHAASSSKYKSYPRAGPQALKVMRRQEPF